MFSSSSRLPIVSSVGAEVVDVSGGVGGWFANGETKFCGGGLLLLRIIGVGSADRERFRGLTAGLGGASGASFENVEDRGDSGRSGRTCAILSPRSVGNCS